MSIHSFLNQWAGNLPLLAKAVEKLNMESKP